VSSLATLISEVEAARARVLAAVDGLTQAQASWKPAPNEWSIVENLEHLVLAEHSGVEKIYRALEAPDAAIETNPNRGLSIEGIIDRTCKPRELAPPIATPQSGGTLAYWVARFCACSHVLTALAVELDGRDLSGIVSLHFLCGPLDARQRLELLRFHMDRHLVEIQAVHARR
jgi:hypothetical protein